jgi:hypothetical protein
MIQDNWRWCHKCQGLYFAGNLSQGACPAGDTHENRGSGDYNLVQKPTSATGQDNWRFCRKCQGLHFAGNPSQGVCPFDHQAHVSDDSGNYVLVQNDRVADWQNNWRFCRKCQGLYFAGNQTDGVCPAGGGHDRSVSGDYSLAQNLDLAILFLGFGPTVTEPVPEFGPSARTINGSPWSGKVFMSVSAPDEMTVVLSSSRPLNASPPPVARVPARNTQSIVFTEPANGTTNSEVIVTISASFRSTTRTAVLFIDPLS